MFSPLGKVKGIGNDYLRYVTVKFKGKKRRRIFIVLVMISVRVIIFELQRFTTWFCAPTYKFLLINCYLFVQISDSFIGYLTFENWIDMQECLY